MPTNGKPREPRGLIPAVVESFLETRLSILFVLTALCLGASAILLTPREEEPQIVVPMADVIVQVPGSSAEEVEKLVTTPLERILWQIDGVEYVYSTSRRNQALTTVRFFVGEDRENSLLKLHNTIQKNLDLVPSVVQNWTVKPVEIDDVPIVMVSLYSDRYDEHQLRRMSEEIFHRLSEVPDVSNVTITGGSSREIRVELDPQRMAGMSVAPEDITRALQGSDTSVTAGTLISANRELTVRSDSFLRSTREVEDVVVGVYQGRPVTLRDVAQVMDVPREAETLTRISFSHRQSQESGLSKETNSGHPCVTLAIAKKRGTNAVWVAQEVHRRMAELERTVLPDGVSYTITRDYGATAQDKVNNLLSSLFFAILTVVILLAFTLGKREAAVVALAVPISFALALFVNYALGYTINRVTLFALILSLGLVVDDPITNVDNIQRHIRLGRLPARKATLFAVSEVLPPVILSTLAIIVSFIPLFFISGMMGPYMAPMAANVPLTVTFSTLAALTIVPWLSHLLLKHKSGADANQTKGNDTSGANPRIARFYSTLVNPFLESRTMRIRLWTAIGLLLLGSCALAAFRLVPLKMLPFDNKNEFQIVINMPEGTPLESTDRVVRRFEDYLRTVPEVDNILTFTGTASPMDFNGMVRHYFLRQGGNMADIRINLADKSRRQQQSHAIVLRLRPDLEIIARQAGADIQVVEVPPGPPVISTLTAEVYGHPEARYSQLLAGADHVAEVMRSEPMVTDVDTVAETIRPYLDFELDKEKAALHGVTSQVVADALSMAVSGVAPATMHLPNERQPLPVRLILPRHKRSSASGLSQIPLHSAPDNAPEGMVSLAELGTFTTQLEDQPIYHKNLRRVAYAFGDMAGRSPAEAVLDMQSRLESDPMPPQTEVTWAGEGEWKITVDVFRDLGLAFGAALLGIFILLVIQTKSWGMPALIMSAIPLTVIGIMPGFWLLNVFFASDVGQLPNPIFFTATSMIGMIALGGIVIRNSLVLIEFIQGAQAQGTPLKQAILQSGAVRLRPIVLTAATTALGAWPITLDPIFSGLAWALITGLFASTGFSLLVVPVAYYALFNDSKAAT
ncbi:efflux RND transporter permease subunit [Desulfovibrio ferrophilus]|uniref:Acriflavin resistance protein n=1 Tax=Desulfovibrio ferrophilus TaxID=241368 RepID=A0A2Z6B369_9BACT|nr:efflux RND transporter permease subunit [Desulfovibrio ferrophilus]BBD09860.1 acriflavin resistance protein [Desulfovibrio ferrophilus]